MECEICYRPFNDNDRKPKNMPCGHVFCCSCIHQTISHGSKNCPTCRTSHGANSASPFPVNFYILNRVDEPPKKVQKLDKYYDEELHAGSCQIHKSRQLYFICRTHDIPVCQECTVINHQPGMCDIISFQEHLEESKSNSMVDVKTKINYVKETSTDLQYYAKKENEELKKKRDLVHRLVQEIKEETEKHDEVKKKITELEEIKKDMESLKEKFASSTTEGEIAISSENLKDKWRTVKKLEEDTDLNALFANLPLTKSLLLERPKRFLEIYRKKPMYRKIVQAYQYILSGQVLLSAELSLNVGKIHLSSLCKKNNQLPQNAVIVKVSHLLELVIPQFNLSFSETQSFPLAFNQVQPEVFLTFASSGNILGTVYISVNTNAPYAKQFLDLFVGTQGFSYKGVNKLGLLSYESLLQHMTYGISCKYHITKSESKDASTMVSSSTTVYYTDIDDNRSEAKLQFTINNFSNLNTSMLSDPCFVSNLPWRIMVTSPRCQPRHSMGFLLQCNGDSKTTSWSCEARANLKLLSHRKNKEPYARKTEHLFSNIKNDWGFKRFIAWDDVLNPCNGYIEDDTLTVEVSLYADKPEGVPLDIENQGATCVNEAQLYMCVQVVLEDAFEGHQGSDLYSIDKVNYQSFRVKKTTSLQEFLEQVANTLQYPVEQIRPWPLQLRNNGTTRPTVIDLETEVHKPLINLSGNKNHWLIFIETLSPNIGLRALPTFDKDLDILFFFKYYNPRNKCLRYCGHHYININLNLLELVSLLNDRAGLPQGTKLALFKEINPNLLHQLTDLDTPLEKSLDVLMDGDIIVFQCADLLNDPSFELPSCNDYFRKNSKSINKKGEVCHYDKSGFAILHDDPPQESKENNSVLGYVTSGLEIISNIAENISKIQPKKRSPISNIQPKKRSSISNVTISEVGIVIKS